MTKQIKTNKWIAHCSVVTSEDIPVPSSMLLLLMPGSEGALEVHLLHLIRVDYSVPQPCSRQSHTKRGSAPVRTGALWSEGSRISLHTRRSKPARRPPHTLSFHFSLIGFGAAGYVCGVWPCECMCVWGRASLCPWTMVALEVPPPVTRERVQAADPLSPCSLLSSPSLVALITLHVPCPFTLATKGREVKVRPSTRVLRSAYYGSVF